MTRSRATNATAPAVSALLLPALLTWLLLPSPAAAKIEVVKRPAEVEHRTFDPDNPPKEMPPLEGDTKAVTAYSFDCTTSVTVETFKRDLPGGRCRMTYTIRGVKTNVGLKVTVWLPEGAEAKLKAHEEGHRQIAEQGYKQAEAVARKAADRIDGRRIVGEGTDCEKAANDQLAVLNKQVNDEYQRLVIRSTDRVQVIYDELTEHGRRREPDEPTAIRMAFEMQAEEAKRAATTQATTRPATRPSGPATRPAGR